MRASNSLGAVFICIAAVAILHAESSDIKQIAGLAKEAGIVRYMPPNRYSELGVEWRKIETLRAKEGMTNRVIARYRAYFAKIKQ